MSIMLVIVIEMIILSAEIGHGLFSIGTQIESILMIITYLVSLVFVIMGTSLHHSELITNINLTNTDNLTKVKNVKAYKERIDELLSLFERYNTPFSMMLFDIDNFKIINDTYGHRAGDAVLIEMSSLIQKNIRLTDTLFRVGGEEFVILCPNTTLYEAIDVAEKVRKVVESDLHTITNQRITISIGVSEVKISDAEDTLYRRVDGLMYRSKQNGKNRVTSTL
jgi:diguanylate cyclase (GGDEF)-like protein